MNNDMMFNFGIKGIYDEVTNRSYIMCGCVWEGTDYHYMISRCVLGSHPSARVESFSRQRNSSTGHPCCFLVDRDQSVWIKKELRLNPAIQWLNANLQQQTHRLSPFIRKIMVFYISQSFGLNETDAKLVIVRYNEGRVSKRKAAKEKRKVKA